MRSTPGELAGVVDGIVALFARPSAGQALSRTTRQSNLVSVIVPHFQDHHSLRGCLDALCRQSYDAASTEVLIVDNGSSPPLRPRDVRRPGLEVRLCHASKQGSYAARNLGIEEAAGEVLAFTDADCRPHRDWLAMGVSAVHKHGERHPVAGRIDVCASPGARANVVERFEMYSAAWNQRNNVEERGYGATANLFVSRQVIEAIGPFDARLKSGGDLEFGQRAQRLGHPVVYCDRASVVHPARATFGDLITRYRRTNGSIFQKEFLLASSPLGRARFVMKHLRLALPPVRYCWKVGRDPGLDVGEKLGLAAVKTLVVTVGTLERTRLFLGGRLERR